MLLITFNVKRKRRDRDIRKYHFASNEEEAPYEMWMKEKGGEK